MDIKTGIQSIYNLAMNKVLYKDYYADFLNDMKDLIYIPDVDENPMTISLNNNMLLLKNKLDAINENPISKIDIWNTYMKWCVWETFYNAGYGHLTDFSIIHNRIKCNVNLTLSIFQGIKETKEDFLKRKEEFYINLEKAGITYKKEKYTNSTYLIKNDKNEEFILNFIKRYCEPSTVEFTTRDNTIRSIVFYINKNGKFNFTKKLEYKDNEPSDILQDYELETIISLTKEWYQAISFELDAQKMDDEKLKNKFTQTTKSLSASIYCSLCSICNVNNDIVEKYNNTVLSNKERNLAIRKKEEQLGASYVLEDLLSSYYLAKTQLEKYFEKYCLFVDKFILSDMNTITVKFSSYMWKSAEYDDEYKIDKDLLNKKLDLLYDDSMEELYILNTEKNLNFIKDKIATEINSRINTITLSYKEDICYIGEIVFSIKDIYKMYENLLEKEIEQ